jgi:hypothetical protein
MALTYAEADAVSSKYFDPTITSQVYDSFPLWTRLKTKNKITWDGGTQIQFPIRYKEVGTAEAVSPRAQISYMAKETRTAGVLDWAYYVGKAIVSWDERVKNTGKPQIINLMKDKTEEMTQDLYEKFADDIVASTQGSLSIQSLYTIIATTSSTYAGISQSDCTEWYSPVVDTTTTRLTLYGTSGSLATSINSLTFGKNHPDLIMTTRNLYSKVESLIEPQKQYSGDSDLAKAGFSTVKFHDIDIVADPHIASAALFILSTDMLEFRYHPDFNFTTSSWGPLEQIGFPNAMAKSVSWAGNLVCRMRKVQGRYSALDYTL